MLVKITGGGTGYQLSMSTAADRLIANQGERIEIGNELRRDRVAEDGT